MCVFDKRSLQRLDLVPCSREFASQFRTTINKSEAIYCVSLSLPACVSYWAGTICLSSLVWWRRPSRGPPTTHSGWPPARCRHRRRPSHVTCVCWPVIRRRAFVVRLLEHVLRLLTHQCMLANSFICSPKSRHSIANARTSGLHMESCSLVTGLAHNTPTTASGCVCRPCVLFVHCDCIPTAVQVTPRVP